MSGCGTRILLGLIVLIAVWYLLAGSPKTVRVPKPNHPPKKTTVYSTVGRLDPTPSTPPKTPVPTKDDTAARLTHKAKQEEFARMIADTPGVLSVEWQTPISLWVKVDLYTLGSPPKERAKEVADIVANAGLGFLKQPICATVFYGNWNELAKSCRQ